MRLFILSTVLCAFASVAVAAPADYNQPQASLYISFAFDRPVAKTAQAEKAALRYGFALDRSHPHELFGTTSAPLLRWEFSHLHFDNLSLAGQPLFTRQMVLAADDEDGGVFEYMKDHTAMIVLGVSAAILTGYIIDADKDSRNRDPSDIKGPGSPKSPN